MIDRRSEAIEVVVVAAMESFEASDTPRMRGVTGLNTFLLALGSVPSAAVAHRVVVVHVIHRTNVEVALETLTLTLTLTL